MSLVLTTEGCEVLARNVEICRWVVQLVVENGVKEGLDAEVESTGQVIECNFALHLGKKKNIIRIFSG